MSEETSNRIEPITDEALATVRKYDAENTHPIQVLARVGALIARLDDTEERKIYWHTRYIADQEKWAARRDAVEAENERLRDVAQRLIDGWADYWDCSRSPGHVGFNEIINQSAEALRG